MRLMTLAAAFAATVALAPAAYARDHHYQHRAYYGYAATQATTRSVFARRYAAAGANFDSAWNSTRGATSRAAADWGASGWGASGWGATNYQQRAQRRANYRPTATNAFAWSAPPAYRATSNLTYRGGASAYHSAIGPRPRAWCGWQMRQMVGSDPGPEYNLARNWAHWGHPGPAGIGAIVVWAHHVGKIVGQQNGHWIIESGNDGNRVRARPLPITHAIAIRWG
jgi:hypothetical protein